MNEQSFASSDVDGILFGIYILHAVICIQTNIEDNIQNHNQQYKYIITPQRDMGISKISCSPVQYLDQSHQFVALRGLDICKQCQHDDGPCGSSTNALLLVHNLEWSLQQVQDPKPTQVYCMITARSNVMYRDKIHVLACIKQQSTTNKTYYNIHFLLQISLSVFGFKPEAVMI